MNLERENQTEAGYQIMFKDYDQPATEAYVKMHPAFEVEIEFLTDSSTRLNKAKNVTVSGIVAQPLNYLKLSLERRVGFQTLSGSRGLVVAPEAWIFHKGLTFRKRKVPSKQLKDLYGIWYVSTQLGQLSESALSQFQLLASNHTKWFKTFSDHLSSWVDNASPLEWSQLEDQDPSGNLKRLRFEKLMQNLCNGLNS